MNHITEIELGALRAGILGDPHLGRSFVRGVPLEKRGLREKMMMDDFRARLQASGSYDIFVCMGDLFDRWAVPYGIVFQAALAYLTAARANPETLYVVIAGNHDISRDLEKKGALDLFGLIVQSMPNVQVVRHSRGAVYHHAPQNDGPKALLTLGFFPFHPTLPADEVVDEYVDVAFGHWDTIFGNENMVPTEKLAMMGCKVAYTGHVHTPDTFTRDGVEVIQVGSMQGLAHGEGDDRYITLGLDELVGRDLSDKCVRVLLKRGEHLAEVPDCLQLTVKREGADTEEAEEVTMGDFNLMALFAQAFEEAGVPAGVRSQLLTRFEEARVGE